MQVLPMGDGIRPVVVGLDVHSYLSNRAKFTPGAEQRKSSSVIPGYRREHIRRVMHFNLLSIRDFTLTSTSECSCFDVRALIQTTEVWTFDIDDVQEKEE